MQQEIEAKFLSVDVDQVREILLQAGATLVHPMRLMRRSVMDYPDRSLQTSKSAWVRIRDEGDKITLTYKESKEQVFGAATEIETTVGSFEKARSIFMATGLIEHSYQENRRETWTLEEAEIVIDEWPWLDAYIEIEASSKAIVKAVAKQLGFGWKNAVFGSVTTAYRAQYADISKDEHISKIPKITFREHRPDWFLKGSNR